MADRVQLSSPKEAEQYILNMVTTCALNNLGLWKQFMQRTKVYVLLEVMWNWIGLHSFCTTLLSDWCRKFVARSQPIRCKTKSCRSFMSRVFPRYRQFPPKLLVAL